MEYNDNTHETYVSFETAKLLKRAGFDWKCSRFYDCTNSDCSRYEEYGAPTLASAQKWLREVKNIYMYVDIQSREKDTNIYEFSFIVWYLGKMYPHMKYFMSYEEALEAGIKRCLEVI